MKLGLGILMVVAMVGCGGESRSSEADTAVAGVRHLLNGEYGAFYDLAHPTVQGATSRADYLACAVESGEPATAKVDYSVLEESDVDYTTKSGGAVPGVAVTVQAKAGTEQITAVLWMVDGKVAALSTPGDPFDEDDEVCLIRL